MKSDALEYLDKDGPFPNKFAKARSKCRYVLRDLSFLFMNQVTIRFGASETPSISEWLVGPLPVSSETNVRQLTEIFT
jgi:primary-amine oxidase